VTGGVSWESYDGNFSAVTVPVVDSSNHAVAAVGEFSLRARMRLLDQSTRSFDVNIEGGLRQFAAMGFLLRDYAPREWVSGVGGNFAQNVGGLGRVSLRGSYRARAIEDRPPMPLFLQPGYESRRGSVLLQLREVEGVSFEGELDMERTDYDAPRLLPQLDLLDRRSWGLELGATTQSPGDAWSVRFFAGLRWSQYRHQDALDAEELFRRDRAVSAGVNWSGQCWQQFLPTRRKQPLYCLECRMGPYSWTPPTCYGR
jgi:hypothetical protein